MQRRKKQIRTKQHITSNELSFPKFDSETGESLDGMPVAQLTQMLRELEENY